MLRNLRQRRFCQPPLRIAALLLPALSLLLCVAPPIAAQAPPPTSAEMLATGVANLRLKLHDALPGVKDGVSTLAAIRQLADYRRLAQKTIALQYPLDDFTGMVLADRWDEAYVAVVDSLVLRFKSLDRDLPSPQSALLFRERLGTLPPLPDMPAAFVVAYLVSRCGGTTVNLPDSLPADVRAGVHEMAVRTIGDITSTYLASRTGDNRIKSEEAWQETVVQRVRCPVHHCGYTELEERSGLKPDGSLYRRYVVECTDGKEKRNLDFDLGDLGAMSRTGGQQHLKGPLPPPGARRTGVDE